MLTKLTIQNFKRFKKKVEIDLGNPVVFVGPNNSGKTSAMQAIYLWNFGLKKWIEKRSENSGTKKIRGVTINRQDLFAIASPESKFLWNSLRTKNLSKEGERTTVSNVRIDIIVEGITNDTSWRCGMEFDYDSSETFHCRPLRNNDGESWMPIPDEAKQLNVALLPPMSGLAVNEIKLAPGAINVKIGEGRTAEVLRNLCLQLSEENPDEWNLVREEINTLFRVKLEDPRSISSRGEITMSYSENNVDLDLSSSGRGLQQTLLILVYMKANPNAIIMLDEPDAHLEIIRQRQNYNLITRIARKNGSQIIAASHSETLLNEAANKDNVVAFIGEPHPMQKSSEVKKALATIGYDHYFQAKMRGWVLYLEGVTDRAILESFAQRLEHTEAIKLLDNAFVHFIGNNPNSAAKHYHGLKEAVPQLKAVALFDRFENNIEMEWIKCLMWKKREIENYLCTEKTLMSYASAMTEEEEKMPLFSQKNIDIREQAMEKAIAETKNALKKLRKNDPWGDDIKASDDFLSPLFENYFESIKLSADIMPKRKFYQLVNHIPDDEIDDEIREKLDAIVAVANSASEQELPS